jgi:hypothetical protein
MSKKSYKERRMYGNELEENIAKAIMEGRPLSGKEGVLTPIIKRALEAALEGEMENHLDNPEEINEKKWKRNKNNKKQLWSIRARNSPR